MKQNIATIFLIAIQDTFLQWVSKYLHCFELAQNILIWLCLLHTYSIHKLYKTEQIYFNNFNPTGQEMLFSAATP